MASEQKGPSVTLPPTHTLTQMPNKLTFVVPTQRRLGVLPAGIIISAGTETVKEDLNVRRKSI